MILDQFKLIESLLNKKLAHSKAITEYQKDKRRIIQSLDVREFCYEQA